MRQSIFAAISPHYALGFMFHHPGITFIILGAVVLCVTGGEALYADMGHFGKKPIRLAWFSLVMPALVINYFGQGAMLLDHPENVRNPFYEMAPTWALYPLIGLATCATVIASQVKTHERFGGVVINDVPSYRVDNMPYGGVKDSGLGREPAQVH